MTIEMLTYGWFKITHNNNVYFTNDFKYHSVNERVYFTLNRTINFDALVSEITLDNVIHPSIDHFMNYLGAWDRRVGYQQVKIFTPEP